MCVQVRVRFRVRVCVCVRVHEHFVCINAGLSGIRSVRYRNEKTNDAGNGPVPDQVKAVRHFLVWYQTEIIDNGMLKPALVFSMPIPSYGAGTVNMTWFSLAIVTGHAQVMG